MQAGKGKLDYLMVLTDMPDTVLAKRTNCEPAIIRGIRTEEIPLPRDPEFIQTVAHIMSLRIHDPYQKASAASRITPGIPWPNSTEGACEVIKKWLEEEPKERKQPAKPAPKREETKKPQAEGSASLVRTEVYRDARGRREALKRLMQRATQKQGTQVSLCLDGDTSWFYEDEAFEQEFASLVMTLAQAGGHLKVVHTLEGDMEHVFAGLNLWIPLYLTNAVEGCYITKIRDKVLRRTMAAVPGEGALVADDLAGAEAYGMSLIVGGEDAAEAVASQFDQLMGLCKPLVLVKVNNGPRSFDELVSQMAAEEDAGDTRRVDEGGIRMAVVEGVGAAMCLAENPKVNFMVVEERLTAAAWEYLG